MFSIWLFIWLFFFFATLGVWTFWSRIHIFFLCFIFVVFLEYQVPRCNIFYTESSSRWIVLCSVVCKWWDLGSDKGDNFRCLQLSVEACSVRKSSRTYGNMLFRGGKLIPKIAIILIMGITVGRIVVQMLLVDNVLLLMDHLIEMERLTGRRRNNWRRWRWLWWEWQWEERSSLQEKAHSCLVYGASPLIYKHHFHWYLISFKT